MGNKELFKTVLFGGFQKEEVWNYMQEVEAEIEGGRQVAERAQQEYAQQLEEENLMRQKLSQQLSDEQERTEKLEEEKNAMESELGTLQAEAVADPALGTHRIWGFSLSGIFYFCGQSLPDRSRRADRKWMADRRRM